MRGKKTTMMLQTYSATTDGMGGYTHAWSGSRNLSGVLVEISPKERMVSDKETVLSTHKFFLDLPTDLTITTRDILVIPTGARKFEITGKDNQGNADVGLVLTLLEIV